MNGTPHENMTTGLSIAPQAIGTTPVNGNAIVRPEELGKFISFLAIGGALVAADALTVKVQARRVGTSTWDDMQDSTGAADLTFTVATMSDAGALESGEVLGTIDISRVKSGAGHNLPPVSSVQYEYDAYRLSAVNANNTTPGIVGFAHIITGLHELPAKTAAGVLQDDDLLLKQLPHVLA